MERNKVGRRVPFENKVRRRLCVERAQSARGNMRLSLERAESRASCLTYPPVSKRLSTKKAISMQPKKFHSVDPRDVASSKGKLESKNTWLDIHKVPSMTTVTEEVEDPTKPYALSRRQSMDLAPPFITQYMCKLQLDDSSWQRLSKAMVDVDETARQDGPCGVEETGSLDMFGVSLDLLPDHASTVCSFYDPETLSTNAPSENNTFYTAIAPSITQFVQDEQLSSSNDGPPKLVPYSAVEDEESSKEESIRIDTSKEDSLKDAWNTWAINYLYISSVGNCLPHTGNPNQ